MTLPHSAADRGTYIGLSRDASAVTNAPSERETRAQDEGLPVRVRNDEAECAAEGGRDSTAQASPFVTVSGAEEVFAAAVDPAPAPDDCHSRLDRPLAPGEHLTADGDRISIRHAAQEA